MIRFVLAGVVTLATTVSAWAIDIQEVTSPGGIKAWLVEERSIPFTALEIRFKGGASLDREGKRGATHLMTALIEEGAGDLDSTEFAAAREALAASYSFDSYDDALTISAQFLTENRGEAVALLKLALIEPAFDEASIARVKAQVQSIIASDAKDPSSIARDAFGLSTWGEHPYGSSIEGTAESVAALTRDDIVTAFADAVALDRIYVGAVGDISAEELGQLMDELLGGLPAEGAPMPTEAEYLLEAGVSVVPFDTPQSVAIFGHEGIPRDDEDFFPAYVLNQVLGAGGFGSRLMTEVREKRGLTYGINTFLVPKDLGHLYLGQFSSSNDKIAEAMDVIRAQWAELAEQGITQEELDDAKTFLTGAYPLRFDGNSTIAGILVGMQMDDLPISYIETRNAQVEAVTLEDIQRVAKRVLRPGDLHFTVVGQPEGIETTN